MLTLASAASAIEANAQDAPFPLALGEIRHAANDQVGAQTPAVAPERGDRAVGGDEERQDVESRVALVADQAGAGPDDRFDSGAHVVGGPRAPIY